MLPVVEAAVETGLPISIDTTKSRVAAAALETGAEIVNDVSALRFDPELPGLVADHGAGLVLMHMRGEPRTMQKDIHYDDLLGEIRAELQASVAKARAAGCAPQTLVIDPGIGFGKTPEHNLEILRRLDRIVELGYPVLVGPSRKSFIGKTLGLPVDERAEATVAACVVALIRGGRIFRVHDVREARRALDMAHVILTGSSSAELT